MTSWHRRVLNTTGFAIIRSRKGLRVIDVSSDRSSFIPSMGTKLQTGIRENSADPDQPVYPQSLIKISTVHIIYIRLDKLVRSFFPELIRTNIIQKCQFRHVPIHWHKHVYCSSTPENMNVKYRLRSHIDLPCERAC